MTIYHKLEFQNHDSTSRLLMRLNNKTKQKAVSKTSFGTLKKERQLFNKETEITTKAKSA